MKKTVNSKKTKTMKTKILLFSMLFLLLPFLFIACSDDDEKVPDIDGLPPKISLTISHIKTELNRDFYIKGTIEDNDGIQSIHLLCDDIHLDKVIHFSTDSIIHTFDLDYKFKLRKDVEGEKFNIQVVVTDWGNRTTEEVLLLTTDGDFTAPRFLQSLDNEIAVLIKEKTKLNVKFKVEDNKALDVVTITIPELDYNQKITEFSNNGKLLEFQEFLTLPSKVATYNLEIVAIDKAGLKTETKSTISVSEMPDFSKMYLADVKSVTQLNNDVFGIPMLIERTDAYTYKARYYCEKEGTELFFIPQKTDFNPISFGIDPSNNKLLTDDPEIALPIVLDSKGYKEIVFNVQTGEFSITSYEPKDKPIEIGKMVYLNDAEPEAGMIPLEVGLVGGGLPNCEEWTPSDPYMLEQNKDNPFLLEAEIVLDKGAIVDFIISAKHSWGWWPEPYWRWDRGDDPEYNVFNGGENPGKWEVQESGTYKFVLDTHLKRSKFYLID